MDGSLKLSGDVGFDYVRCCANALVNLKFQLIHALQADTHQDNKSKFQYLKSHDELNVYFDR